MNTYKLSENNKYYEHDFSDLTVGEICEGPYALRMVSEEPKIDMFYVGFDDLAFRVLMNKGKMVRNMEILFMEMLEIMNACADDDKKLSRDDAKRMKFSEFLSNSRSQTVMIPQKLTVQTDDGEKEYGFFDGKEIKREAPPPQAENKKPSISDYV